MFLALLWIFLFQYAACCLTRVDSTSERLRRSLERGYYQGGSSEDNDDCSVVVKVVFIGCPIHGNSPGSGSGSSGSRV